MAATVTPGSGNVASLSASATSSIIAITTPFIPPTDCVKAYEVVTSSQFIWRAGILVSNIANPYYIKCQPSGLASKVVSLGTSSVPQSVRVAGSIIRRQRQRSIRNSSQLLHVVMCTFASLLQTFPYLQAKD